MFKFFHGAPYAVCVELCFVLEVFCLLRVWECAGVGTYGGLCGGEMWGESGESGRVGCIRSRV